MNHTLRMEKGEGIVDKIICFAIFLTVVLAGTYNYPWLIMGCARMFV